MIKKESKSFVNGCVNDDGSMSLIIRQNNFHRERKSTMCHISNNSPLMELAELENFTFWNH
uniref:Uncharacterized protein n=1 Tax=Wuchereria bancrofti TaxID=6293 RepID=A0A1I8EXY4_WUCBA